MTWTCYPHRTVSHQNAPNHGTKWPQKRHRIIPVSILESHDLRIFGPPRICVIEKVPKVQNIHSRKCLISLGDMAKKRPQKRPQISPEIALSIPADSNPNQCRCHRRMHGENACGTGVSPLSRTQIREYAIVVYRV